MTHGRIWSQLPLLYARFVRTVRRLRCMHVFTKRQDFHVAKNRKLSEAFQDSSNLLKPAVRVAAEKMITRPSSCLPRASRC